MRFEAHPVRYTYCLIALYLFFNNSVNAVSVWAEHNRLGTAQINNVGTLCLGIFQCTQYVLFVATYVLYLQTFSNQINQY